MKSLVKESLFRRYLVLLLLININTLWYIQPSNVKIKYKVLTAFKKNYQNVYIQTVTFYSTVLKTKYTPTNIINPKFHHYSDYINLSI